VQRLRKGKVAGAKGGKEEESAGSGVGGGGGRGRRAGNVGGDERNLGSG